MQEWISAVTEHAMNTVWANPHVDKQFITHPVRITSLDGESGSYRFPFKTIGMPAPNVKYVLYAMGQLSPRFYGLEGVMMAWKRLDVHCNEQKLIVMAHTDYRIIPSSVIHVRRTEHGDVIFAIEAAHAKQLLDQKEEVYFRFYSNAWYGTAAGTGKIAVDVLGGQVGTTTNVGDLITKVNDCNALGYGRPLTFINGYYHDKLNANLATTGDIAEVLFDGSIAGSFDIALDDVDSFTSKLDLARKLLVMAPDSFKGKWYFFDDVEFFICNTFKKDAMPYVKGVYVARLNRGDIRQITQQDWAIAYNRIADAIQEQNGLIPYSGAFIRCIVRNATGPTPYILNENYTPDLLQLPYAERRRLMTGTGAVVERWRAETLEQSNYIEWVSSYLRELKDIDHVFNFYGVYKFLETGSKRAPGQFNMPLTMKDGGLVIETNSSGELVRINQTTKYDYSLVYISDPGTQFCEFIPGSNVTTGSSLDSLSDFKADTLSPYKEMRMVKEVSKGWEIAKNGIHYTVVNDAVDWKPTYINAERLKRAANRYSYRQATIGRDDLGVAFNFYADGSDSDSGLGFASYAVIMNKRRLVRGVDFFVLWPNIYIRNQEYAADVNDVHIVGHGVGEPLPLPHWGFVEHSRISKDDKFNLHLWRCNTFYLDGKICSEDDTIFAEGYKSPFNPTNALPSGTREGALFCVERPVSHIGHTTEMALKVGQEQALLVDASLENYLSKVYRQYASTAPVVISHKHTLISVLMRAVLNDMKTGLLNIVRNDMSDVAVGITIKPYEALIELEVNRLKAHEGYIQMAAHASNSIIRLTQAEYHFMERINALYLDGRVILSNYFSV